MRLFKMSLVVLALLQAGGVCADECPLSESSLEPVFKGAQVVDLRTTGFRRW